MRRCRRVRVPRVTVPRLLRGNFFFADYAQNWIKRLTFDAGGAVNGVYNVEPIDGTPDGPTGDIVYLIEGPDGALYYVDLGFSDTTHTAGISKICRIRFTNGGNQPPIAGDGRDAELGVSARHSEFLQRGLVGPGRTTALVLVDVR